MNVIQQEGLTILSDREVLTQTLLETSQMLWESRSLPCTWRPHARVLFLLRTLCASHLSPSQVTSTRQRSEALLRALSQERNRSLLDATTFSR